MIGVMENKQKELELELDRAYVNTQKANKKYTRWLWIRIFNKRNLKQVVKAIENQNEVFKQLREITRENHPERFIQSNKESVI